MKPTSNWEKTNAQTGLNETLSPGGHQVVIMNAECKQSRAGREMLVIYFDIDEGSEYDGIMLRTYQRKKGFGDAKWPNMGTMYQLTVDKDGYTNPRFKGLIKAVEETNSGYKWDWNETNLKGKRLGVVFGEEEIVGTNDGKVHVVLKPRWVCEGEKAKDQPVPTLRKLPEDQRPADAPEQFTPDDDDSELPF